MTVRPRKVCETADIISSSCTSRERVRSTLKQVYGSLPKGYDGVRMRGQLLAAMAHTYDAELMPFILGQLNDKKTNPEVRLIAAQNYALLANKEEAAKFAAAIANEQPSEAGGYREKFAEHKPLMTLANECNTAVECWVGKVGSADPSIARKAAYMLGRYGTGSSKAIAALVDQLGSEDLGVRLGSLMALDNIAEDGAPDAVVKIDELRSREEGQSVWTMFRVEALPVQARLRSRGENS